MPPNRSQSSQKSIEQEGRVLLAIEAIQKYQITSVREAARRFSVPEATLRRRLAGHTNRHDTRANNHKLTETEEYTLLQWILSMDSRGAAPSPTAVREIANILLAQRGQTPLETVGQKWAYNFTQRQPEIKGRYSRRYDYQRAKNEDPTIIQQWFNLVQETIIQYGIASEDIYNFDETGFAMGLTATARAITHAEYHGRRPILQPGNREWVTSIEAINATGWALPPYLIFKGKVFIESWFDDLLLNWRIDISPNGWTTDQIGLSWLKDHFIPLTNSRITGDYRLLILDGHGSHLTPQFDQICKQNKIIPICMPAHASHLLQPLDVGCFAVLKRAYGSLVDKQMRCGFNHIDKLDFLAAYPSARAEAYKPANIQNSFAATGIVPYSPDRVLLKLNIQLKTPTPPGSQAGSQTSNSSLKTPQNQRQLHRQASSIKALYNRNSNSPPGRALNQLIKGSQLAMQAGAILAQENKDLRAANEKKKQKRARSKRQITHQGSLSMEDAQQVIRGLNQPSEVEIVTQMAAAAPAISPSQRPARRPPTCSLCGNVGHKINQCPSR